MPVQRKPLIYRRTMPVEYYIEVLPEYTDPFDHFCTGCEVSDLELASQIKSDLESNPWAWCTVKVTATAFNGSASGESYLAGCNYKDEDEFRSGLYFSHMKNEALDDMIDKLNDGLFPNAINVVIPGLSGPIGYTTVSKKTINEVESTAKFNLLPIIN